MTLLREQAVLLLKLALVFGLSLSATLTLCWYLIHAVHAHDAQLGLATSSLDSLSLRSFSSLQELQRSHQTFLHIFAVDYPLALLCFACVYVMKQVRWLYCSFLGEAAVLIDGFARRSRSLAQRCSISSLALCCRSTWHSRWSRCSQPVVHLCVIYYRAFWPQKPLSRASATVFCRGSCRCCASRSNKRVRKASCCSCCSSCVCSRSRRTGFSTWPVPGCKCRSRCSRPRSALDSCHTTSSQCRLEPCCRRSRARATCWTRALSARSYCWLWVCSCLRSSRSASTRRKLPRPSRTRRRLDDIIGL